ncbi:MAG: LVIVD repeat-containing protein [Gemmatimonadales bacterium]
MKTLSLTQHPLVRWMAGPLVPLSLAAALLTLAGCAGSSSSSAAVPSTGAAPSDGIDMSVTSPKPDPRVGLGAGWFDAKEAIWNLRVVSKTPPSTAFLNPSTPGDRRLVNSDLAMSGNYVIQGNYSGYQVWDISNPRKPTLKTAYVCPGSQSDVSIYKNLMFVSGESPAGRLDCGMQGVTDTVSQDRLRGIRIFDATDIAHPKYVANVQTCRGSHTHTVVDDPNDNANVYIYVSGSSGVRSPTELAGCSGLTPDQDPNSALFRIEVIQVPLAHPEQAHIVSSPRIFQDLTAAPRHAEPAADQAAQAARQTAAAAAGRGGRGGAGGRGGRGGRGAAADAGPRPGPNQCHDITVYPAIGLAGGACGGYGLLLDIHDVAHPKRLYAAADSNMSFWHSATFNNDGTRMLFSDEWGGGGQPKCRETDKMEWGADAIFTIDNNKLNFHSYFKMPAAQTVFENCVAHNGSLIPIPGRDIMVQSWYQGGISVFEWTDPSHPREIAFFDRGPMDGTKFVDAGYWSSYWYNGYIIASEIARGMDMFELKPSGLISQNEIDAAKSVHLDFFNAQDQPKIVWPASFAVPRSYLDQLARDNGQSADKIASARSALATAEKMSGSARKDALTKLATQLHGDATGAKDAPKAHKLASAVGDLAGATR